MIAHSAESAKYHRFRLSLRKCSRQEDGSILIARPALAHQEHHILTAFEAGYQAIVFALAIDSLFVNFKYHVTASQAHVVRERTILHVLNDHAFAGGNFQLVRHLRSDAANRSAPVCFL